jgi:hypothetical protein
MDNKYFRKASIPAAVTPTGDAFGSISFYDLTD